jgi:hypothetical protein
MSHTSCRPVTDFLTKYMSDPDTRKSLRALRASKAGRDQYVALFAAGAPPDIAAVMREEFAALPPLAVTTLVEAWALADAAGKTFTVASVEPDKATEFARARRVRITIDAEESGVRVSLSHIPTKHANWYAAAGASA